MQFRHLTRCLALFLFSSAALSQSPPAWDEALKTTTPKYKQAAGKTTTHTPKKSEEDIFWSAGPALSASFVDLLSIDAYVHINSYLGLRAYFSPPISIPVRVEMPADVISTKKNVGVANPAFDINLLATIGPQYGLEAMYHPLGNGLFVFGGAGVRHVKVKGDTRSPVLICSIYEAIKEPPCGDSTAAIQSRSELLVAADATATIGITRFGAGWLWWTPGDLIFVAASLGMTLPYKARTGVTVQAAIDAPGDENDSEITGALAELKASKEAEMEDKAFKEVDPVVRRRLMHAGLSIGFFF